MLDMNHENSCIQINLNMTGRPAPYVFVTGDVYF
jgi:hypothetical protein